MAAAFVVQGSLSKVAVKIGSKALPYRYAVRPGGL